MNNFIKRKYLKKFWNPKEIHGHRRYLAPIMAIHSVLQIECNDRKNWRWNNRGVEEALPALWNMTGSWGARRDKTFRKSKFAKVLIAEIKYLGSLFNKYQIFSLIDIDRLAHLEQKEYEKIVRAIHFSIVNFAKLRKTKQYQPILGSKVLHHFFPSIIPIFDEALIFKGALKTKEFISEINDKNSNLYKDGWIFLKDVKEASGEKMLRFHKYFAYCAMQLNCADKEELTYIRKEFGNAFKKPMPLMMVENRKSILWKMDAKIAEYCLLGLAKVEGLLPPPKEAMVMRQSQLCEIAK